MMSFRAWLLCCVAALFLSLPAFAETSTPAASAAQVSLSEPHAKIVRVEPPALPDLSNTQFSGGVYDLLVDEQHLVEERIGYYHYATYISAQEGLQENSQIEATYDPSFQRLSFHFVRIIRGKEVIDCWKDGQVQLLQRENDMERHIFDGRVSAVLVLSGLRVGDIVEYAYSLEGSNHVFDDSFYFSFTSRWSRPVEQVLQRVVAPKTMNAFNRVHDGSKEPEITESEQDKEWTWKQQKVTALLREDRVPYWIDTLAWAEVGSYRDWQEVAAWAWKLYQPLEKEPLSPELEAKLEEIRKSSDDPLIQASAALQLVQEDIRYLGFEMGSGSHAPNPPGLVWERRFGDCKDKALLLTVVLRRLGLEADPAMVNTDYRGEIAKWLPSPQAFDHAITRLRYKEKDYWLDPTRSGQRGPLDEIYIGDFQQALVIREGETGLTPMLWSAPKSPLVSVEETYHSTDFDSPAKLEVKTRYRSYEADHTRVYFRSSSREKVEKGFLEYYADQYPHIRRDGAVQIDDNPQKNELTVTETYLIDGFWKLSEAKTENKAEFDATMVRSRIPDSAGSQRTMPLEISYPVSVEQSTKINLPHKWKVTPDKLELKDPAFEFFFEQKGTGSLVELEYKFKTLDKEVAPEKVKEFGEKIAQAKENTGFWVSSPVKSQEEVTPPASSFHPNWGIIGFTLLLMVGFSYMAYRLVKWDRGLPYPPCPPHLAQYEGLKGWLTLVGLGVILRPLVILVSALSYSWIYSTESWESLTSPSSANYHVLWAPVLLAEVTYNLAASALGFALIFLFFQRRRHFPKLISIFLVTSFLALWLDYIAAKQLPGADPKILSALAQDAFRATIQTFIWVPYFFLSKRVKATFRR